MDAQFVQFFVSRWKKYFAASELPICYFYTDHVRDEDMPTSTLAERGLIGNPND